MSANGSLPDALSAWLTSSSDVRTALATILGTDALKETNAFGGKPVQTLPAWIKRHEWMRLPFGAFAQSINERVEPSQAGDEIYVGLEHLDPQDLHIRRWGKGSDVIGTKLRFRKGDLIFGRRRAYQRKLAVAEFDGICSAHAMVVRARPDVVLPEFLPFLMMSDLFMHRAVEISVGSLSPTINWSTLKLEEFTIPPLDQQRRIAEILWTVDDVVCSYQNMIEEYDTYNEALFADSHSVRGNRVHSIRDDVFDSIPKGWCVEPLQQIADVAYGISEAVASNTDPSLGWPILTGANITLSGQFDLSKLVYISPPTKPDFILKRGDVLFNWRSGSVEHVGKTVIFDMEGDWTYASFILRIRVNKRMNNRFL